MRSFDVLASSQTPVGPADRFTGVAVRVSPEDRGAAVWGFLLTLRTNLPVHFRLLLHIGNYDQLPQRWQR